MSSAMNGANGVVAGEIVHVEFPSRDFTRSAAFYSSLFGWKTDGVQAGGHLRFAPPGGIEGSWIRDALAHAPGPVPFVAVADVDVTLAQAEKQGGRVLVPRLNLPGRGNFGLLADGDGNVIGVLAVGGATKADQVKADQVKADQPKADQAAKAPKAKAAERPSDDEAAPSKGAGKSAAAISPAKADTKLAGKGSERAGSAKLAPAKKPLPRKR